MQYACTYLAINWTCGVNFEQLAIHDVTEVLKSIYIRI
jgi:hypothetical protein